MKQVGLTTQTGWDAMVVNQRVSRISSSVMTSGWGRLGHWADGFGAGSTSLAISRCMPMGARSACCLSLCMDHACTYICLLLLAAHGVKWLWVARVWQSITPALGAVFGCPVDSMRRGRLARPPPAAVPLTKSCAQSRRTPASVVDACFDAAATGRRSCVARWPRPRRRTGGYGNVIVLESPKLVTSTRVRVACLRACMAHARILVGDSLQLMTYV